ncbi:hypothetical protein ACMA5I_10335 [Paracoccaceae bacterium GXU_MW_L88]
MEKYENDYQNDTDTSTTDQTTTEDTNEQVEANTSDNETSDSTRQSDDEPTGDSLNRKLEELGLDRAEYFKLKGKKDGEESGESRKEDRTSQKEVASNDALLARLESRGVMDADDQDYVIKTAKALGVSPVEALNDAVVKDRLDYNKKARANAEATGESNRTSARNPKNSVEYYLKKPDIKLSAIEDKDLRRKVMHARSAQKNKNVMFRN